MSQITIQINGRPYTVGCEDGQEAHLTELAAAFDRQVQQVSEAVGPLAETRLFLMAALMLADDLADARSQLAAVRNLTDHVTKDRAQLDARSAKAIEMIAHRIEALVAKTDL
jgi:cell division protein ZapA